MSTNGSGNPDTTFGNVYGAAASDPALEVWSVKPSATTQNPVSTQFAIPADLDTTKTVTLQLHFFVNTISGSVGNVANAQIKADYAASGVQIGVSAPATGFKETVTSGNFTITEPTGANNLTHVVTSVTLDGSKMAGRNWAFISCSRVAPTSGTEYSKNIYLNVMALQYTRICS
jgi:hypothetical protein